jgi:hypothetical protein
MLHALKMADRRSLLTMIFRGGFWLLIFRNA